MRYVLFSTVPRRVSVSLAAAIMGSLVVLFGGCAPSSPSNYNVNEHNFVKVWQQGRTEELASKSWEILMPRGPERLFNSPVSPVMVL